MNWKVIVSLAVVLALLFGVQLLRTGELPGDSPSTSSSEQSDQRLTPAQGSVRDESFDSDTTDTELSNQLFVPAKQGTAEYLAANDLAPEALKKIRNVIRQEIVSLNLTALKSLAVAQTGDVPDFQFPLFDGETCQMSGEHVKINETDNDMQWVWGYCKGIGEFTGAVHKTGSLFRGKIANDASLIDKSTMPTSFGIAPLNENHSVVYEFEYKPPIQYSDQDNG